MSPRSPLPPRHGLQATWVHTPDRGASAPWATMREFLFDKLEPDHDCVDPMLARGDLVDEHSAPWRGDEPYRPNTFIWSHRELQPKAEAPGVLEMLYRDERAVVFDKPHFLSIIPRDRHVPQSAVMKGRAVTGLSELSAAHWLDHGTSGVLLTTMGKWWCPTYQDALARREVSKVYEAITSFDPDPGFPRMMRSYLAKRVGVLQVETLNLSPNSETWIDVIEVYGVRVRYGVRPQTGRTHQTHAHFNQPGLPLLGDPFYPVISGVDIDDFTAPLRLLARELSFTDPVSENERRFTSCRRLVWPNEVA